MNIRKFATITVLVLSSFAATNVAPTKAELEAMYDKAFREFNSNNYPQALKELDAIDARQPDLAESHNLRGVILMRQAQYDQAEVSLQKALTADPKFWNARFNLAEIPFLRKDWTEARKRFDALLQGDAAELQGDAAQLIQYKILLTYLLQGNENMVDSILAKFELSPDTPAASYSRVAMALQEKKQKEATDLLATAEKSFSPQMNKLFAESLYEVGWLQKPAGQARAALELTSAADRAAKSKASAAEAYEKAEQAFQQFDLPAARKLVEEADAADPNQAATINLRGEILLAQKDFDGAEAAFKRALKIDPKMSEAHYNLAQIPFKKKEYAKARDRFEALFSAIPASGGDKNQTAQIIRFKIYLTLLLEGKDSRAQKVMEQFKFTGDTPALYYAQAAWEFKHDNGAKANLWIVSARKIYSPALNLVFAESFYDLGWLQRQQSAAAATTEVAKNDNPSIEPSPIPDSNLASNAPANQPAENPALKSAVTVPGQETALKEAAMAASPSQPLVAKEEKVVTAPEASPKVETPVAPNAVAAVPKEAVQAQSSVPPKAATLLQQNQAKNLAAAAAKKAAQPAAVSKSAGTPATVLAPKTVREWSQPSFIERLDRLTGSHTLAVGALVSAATLLLAWVVYIELRRRVRGTVYRSPAPVTGLRYDAPERETKPVQVTAPIRITGGPPQISLQLKASEPSVRRAAVPFGKGNRPVGAGGTFAPAGNGSVAERFAPREAPQISEPEPFKAALPPAIGEDALVSDVRPPHDLAPAPVSEVPTLAAAPEWDFTPAKTHGAPADQVPPAIIEETPVLAEAFAGSETLALLDAPATDHTPIAFMMPEPVETVVEPSMIEGPSVEEAPEPPVTGEPDVEGASPQPSVVEETVVEARTTQPELVEEPPVEARTTEPELAEEPSVEARTTEPELAEEPSVEARTTEPELVEEPPVEARTTEPELVEEPPVEARTTEPELAEEPPVEVRTTEILDVGKPPIEPWSMKEPAIGEPIVNELAVEEPEKPVVDDSAVEELEAEEPEVEEPAIKWPGAEHTIGDEPGVEPRTFFETVSEPRPIPSEMLVESAASSAIESSGDETEPVAQGQPIPYQIPASLTDSVVPEVGDTEPESLATERPEWEEVEESEFRPLVEPPPFAPQIISTEPLVQQPTTPAIMPQTIQPTPVPIRTAPVTGAGPQPASGLQTAVQLTFSFEIASLQLTPSFKMGALQLKPTSKIVTMRLAPSQQPQPAMNLQVTFEISSVQLAGNSLGIIRLTPSQQQRPGVINTPAFNIAGLQLLSGADSAVQLTPSQQGQASVHVTGRFQISTVEFSPSFEIASIVLNSTSKNVSVQLPGAGPSAVEGAPVFEITNVQLAGNGDIGLMQLNAQGVPPKPV